MAYTEDDFQKWIFLIDLKMGYFTGEFAQRYQLTLDYSLASLDEIESWILTNYATLDQLLADREILDYLTIYIGETFRKHIGGKWFMDLENKKNITRFAVEICPLGIPTHPKDIALPERAGVQWEPSAPK